MMPTKQELVDAIVDYDKAATPNLKQFAADRLNAMIDLLFGPPVQAEESGE